MNIFLPNFQLSRLTWKGRNSECIKKKSNDMISSEYDVEILRLMIGILKAEVLVAIRMFVDCYSQSFQ